MSRLRRPFEENPGPIRRVRNRVQQWMYDHQDGIETFMLISAVAGAIAIICLGVLALSVYANEKGCNVKGEELGLETDYRFWGNTCYATLADGRTVDANTIRATSEGVTLPGEE